MAEKKNNLDLWNKVEKTDPKYTKDVGYGRKFTSVNAQYQVKNATEQFGLYGETWGISKVDYQILDELPHGEVLILAKAQFFFPSGNFPISSTIKMVSWNANKQTLHTDDEWAKKVETDITTKALSKLGFNADVFLGRYDDNRYVNDLKAEFNPKPKQAVKPQPSKVDLTRDQYEAVIKAVEGAGIVNLPAIERKMDKYDQEGKLLKQVRKVIENKVVAMRPKEK